MTLISTTSPPVPIDVSIVIVNYNVKEFLLHCIESVYRSVNSLSVEIIVVDNNSRDGSVEFLEPKFPDVNFIVLSENVGFGRGNNAGIERSRGRYILLLNPDTIIQEDTLAKMYEYMEKHHDVGICGCKVLNSDGSFQMQCRRGFPSPWASFCKLFGLQALFPNSPLFARYNQTFRDEDETYYVDALIGAFMFCRREPLVLLHGFDPEFFMYGEDLDLCYRMQKSGLKTAYVPITTIVHFKGESTRRSSVNELKVFYEAMEIFARKHYGSSSVFLAFLRIGIQLRSMIAYLTRNRSGVVIMICDSLSVLLTFLLAVKLRRGDYFALPAYAFPTTLIVIPLVVAFSMILVGEYFEYKPTVRRAAVGLLISFFILSSLTYYWNEYAFSRGVLIMTIGFSLIAAALIRAIAALGEKIFGSESKRRVILVAPAKKAESVASNLQKENALHVHVLGYVSNSSSANDQEVSIPLLGQPDYLLKIVEQYSVDEVIILDEGTSHASFISMMKAASKLGVRFHFIKDGGSVVALGIAERISTRKFVIPYYRILSLRSKFFKRSIDLISSTVALLILSPVVFLMRRDRDHPLQKWWQVFRGKLSVVGLYPPPGELAAVAKNGITGLAHISHPHQLSSQTIADLNEYYVRNYTPSLDVDILIKHVFPSR